MSDEAEGEDKRLNKLVAVTVVVFTVLLAVGGIKGGNVVQAMDRAKADAVDQWGYYQSNRVKLHFEENSLALLDLMVASNDVDAAAAGKQKAVYLEDVKKYEARSAEAMARAKELETNYDLYNQRDDQLDFSEAFIEFGIALAAVAALVELYWLLYVAWGSGLIGAYFSLAGFLGLEGRPEWLVKIFGV